MKWLINHVLLLVNIILYHPSIRAHAWSCAPAFPFFPSHGRTCAHTDQLLTLFFFFFIYLINASFGSEMKTIPRPPLPRVDGKLPFYPRAQQGGRFPHPIEASDHRRAIFSSLIMEFTCQPIGDYS